MIKIFYITKFLFFVVNDKNEVLLQKRSPKKRFKPNKWGLCSGHVDAFESLEQAAIREVEVYEEIGLKIKEKDLHPFYGRKIYKKEHFYYIKSNLKEEDFVIQNEELTEVKWVPIEEIENWINIGKTSFSKERLEELESLKQELVKNKDTLLKE